MCDGICGNVKCSTANANLQGLLSYQILTICDMLTFCKDVIRDITFQLYSEILQRSR